MNIDYVLVFSILSIPRILIVRSRKLKREKVATSESEGEEAWHTYRPFELYLTGNIRRYFAMNAADSKHNVVCSPVGAMLPLGKMAYGAENSTRSEMLNALGIKSGARLGPAMRKIIKMLQYLPGVTLNMASSLFVSNKYQRDEEFVKKCSRTFTSLIEPVDCGTGDVAGKINQWVCDNTKGKIGNIIKSERQICSQKSLIVTSAVYFKGEWQKPFLRSFIKDFHSAFGVKKIPMMIVNDVFMYGRTNILNAQIVEIPYINGSASFIIVLPYFKDGLPLVLKQIKQAPTLLNIAIKTLRPREMILSMPKFKLISEVDLKKLYEDIGVKTAMCPQNSLLNKIVQGETLYISKAIQKTVLEVTETGTDEEFIPPDHIDIEMNLDQVLFFADHPFLFYVTSDREQLFAGVYNGIPSPLENENKCF